MANNNRIEEALSALMDNEAAELETHRAVKGVAQDSDLRDTWHRYQLASAAMKRDLPPRMVDLSGRISAALDEEKSHKPSLRNFLQPMGKVAVAASVALVAVLGVQQLQVSSSPGVSQPAAEVAEAATGVSGDSGASQFQLPAGFDLPPVSARTVSAGSSFEQQARPTLVVSRRPVADIENEQAIREFLNRKMEQHTQNAAFTSSSQGILPLARLPQVDESNP